MLMQAMKLRKQRVESSGWMCKKSENIMSKIVIHDTNFYRAFYENVVLKQPEDERKLCMIGLHNHELANGYSKKINLLVLLEILKHLETGDPLQELYLGITNLVFQQATTFNKFEFIEMPEYRIQQMLFNYKDEKIATAINVIATLFCEIQNASIDFINSDTIQQKIKTLKDTIQYYKDSFSSDYLNTLSKYLREEKGFKKRFMRLFISNDESLYRKIFYDLVSFSKSQIPTNAELRENEMANCYSDCFLGISMMINFGRRVLSSEGKFNFEKNENDIIDCLICHGISLNENSIFVTAENKIYSVFNDVGHSSKVIHTNQFLKLIGIPIITELNSNFNQQKSP